MTTLEIAPDRVITRPEPPPAVEQPPHERRVSRHGWITAAIGVVTAALYTWNLSAVGMGNGYYAAAVKSGTVSWKAFFFGSLDAGSFITVDKPPAALWLQELSARVFGFSTWSMLLPEAAAGVASVLLLHRLVRKWMGDVAAHIAAIAFAVTPVALMMFRYNNPDALLTLLCIGAASALWSALENGKTRMVVLSAALLGLAFETKMLQAFLVVPAFILVYLWAGKPKLGRRIAQLAAGLAAMVVSAGWWVAIVALWPASARPYIGSTQNNSILSLIFGYNGLSRIFGGSSGGPGGGGMGGNAGFGGASGILRMFNASNAGQISWLLPIAGVSLVAGLWLTRWNRRTDLRRAGWLLWGGWAAVSLAVFSLSSGIFHQYYTIQVAPAVAALAGAGGITLWRLGRHHRWLRPVLPITILGTAAWAVVVLDRTPTFASWLRPLVIAGAVTSAALLWFGDVLRQKAVVIAAAVIAAGVLLAGPVAYSLTTIEHPTTGSIVSAGPSSAGLGGGQGGPGAESSTADTALITYLEAHQGTAKYLVATFGSGTSEGIIIATGKPVVTIGGFSGSDPAPTLAQFEAMVRSGEVRYVLVSGNGGGGFGGGPGGGNSSITSWITSVGTTVSYGGSSGTLYDLSAAAS